MVMGVGGVVASILGGVMTQYTHPRWSFLIFSLSGLALVCAGVNLSEEAELEELPANQDGSAIDQQQPQEENKGFCSQLTENLRQIAYALTLKEIYMVLFFYMLQGILQPSFGEFGYFFMLTTCKISKFTYAATNLVTKVSFIVGTWYYKEYLKDIENRTIIFWGTIMGIVSGVASLAWAMRLNLVIGISDLVFVLLTDVVFGIVARALNVLPCLALFAKITPKGIEGTIFAFLTGMSNFADLVISPAIGAFINNRFIHVTSKDFNNGDLSGFVKLKWIGLFCSFLPLLTLFLIPLAADIR